MDEKRLELQLVIPAPANLDFERCAHSEICRNCPEEDCEQKQACRVCEKPDCFYRSAGPKIPLN